jgi:F-box-like
LAFIRARVSHLQSVVDRDTHEANEALAIYEATKIRYDAQLLVLQELKSQLYIAKQTADALKRHAWSLDEELEALRGLIHPIRRCPDDVMRTIFESVATLDSRNEERGYWGWDRGAIQLSHVCQRWRDLALSTPMIWGHISFGLYDKHHAMESMAHAFIRRIKNIPAKIMFRLVHDEENPQDPTKAVKSIPFHLIYSVPQISSINFVIGQADDTASLLNAVNWFPDKPFGSLTISSDFSAPEDASLYQFLFKFCPFRKLKLEYISFGPVISGDFDGLEAFTEMEALHLHYVHDVPLIHLLQKMPRLQTLEVRGCSVVPTTNGSAPECTLLNLSSLDAGPSFPWAQINCPNLILLTVDLREAEAEHEDFGRFLSRAKSIREVKLHDVEEAGFLARLAREAAQLERLHLTRASDSAVMSVLVNWQQFGLTGPPFPQLLALTLEPSRDLGSLTLDRLIQSRCFPVGHPESTMEKGINHVLKEFRVTAGWLPTGRDKWQGSRFLQTHFSRSRDVQIQPIFGSEPGFRCFPEVIYTFIGNTDEVGESVNQ